MKRRALVTIAVLFVLSSCYAVDVTQEFKNRNGQDWDVRVADWGYVLFAAREEPDLVNPPVDESGATEIARAFLESNADLLGMESINVVDVQLSGGVDVASSLWVIDYEGQYYEGIPVIDTYTKVLMQLDGQIYGVGNMRYYFEQDLPEPSIPPGQAGSAGQAAMGTSMSPSSITKALYVENNELKPAWSVNFSELNKSVVVDGTNGTVLRIENLGKIPIVQEKGLSGMDYLVIAASFLVLLLMLFLLLKGRGK